MMRARAIELAVASLLVIAAGTELLSLAGSLQRGPVLVIWCGLAAMWWLGLRPAMHRPQSKDLWVWVPGSVAAGIWAVEGILAIASPPNSSDAMAYHMPRVVYWLQQQSVEHFATPYLNQIMLQPLAEYLILHLHLLTDSDRLANCGAWLATGGYILASSVLAERLGAAARGQAGAAFLAATLPNGILQASGAKNEALLTFLLLSMAGFALEKRKWEAAAACGLACLTKGTGYVFAGPLILALLPQAALHCVVVTALISGPFYIRNLDLSGSPLGFDSVHGDGVYRWRNDHPGWQAAASNWLRHAGDQIPARSDGWNQGIYGMVVHAHRRIGIDVDDRSTTWTGEHYAAPRNTNHESDANNRYHLALILMAAAWSVRRRDTPILKILLAAAAGLVLFCFYLKWQPAMLRMFLPLYGLAVVAASIQVTRLPLVVQAAVFVLLLDGCRLPLLKAWTRPLLGPASVLSVPRADQYFADIEVWKVREKYLAVVKELDRLPCRTIGMDIRRFQMEYPLLAILRERDAGYQFVHVRTPNASRKYEGRMSHMRPCVIVCLACERWVEPVRP